MLLIYPTAIHVHIIIKPSHWTGLTLNVKVMEITFGKSDVTSKEMHWELPSHLVRCLFVWNPRLTADLIF